MVFQKQNTALFTEWPLFAGGACNRSAQKIHDWTAG